MSDRGQNQMMLITSIVLAIVSMILMGVMKHSLQKIPFIDRLFQLKNIGVDSMKDFLEVSELKLRVLEPSPNYSKVDHTETVGATIEWDSDDSTTYLIFISAEYIPKIKLIHAESIPDFDERELNTLQNSSNWTRKLLIKAPVVNASTKIKTLRQRINLKKFNCRVRSDYGRISRHLAYPADGKPKLHRNEIDVWILTKGRDYHLCIFESVPGTILEYSVMLYVKDGMGLKINIPPFKQFIDFNLGPVVPSLCYLTGVRSVGIPFEQFVGWLGQEKVLYSDGELSEYLPQSGSLATAL